MRKTVVGFAIATLLALSGVSGPAIAQSLDKLPKLVADEIRTAERQCRAAKGEPSYEIANVVRSYYMGPVGAGRETFVITFDDFACLVPDADESDRKDGDEPERKDSDEPDPFAEGSAAVSTRSDLFCDDIGCRIAVFLPGQRNQWVKVFDHIVITWAPQQRDGNIEGPNVRLRIVTMGPRCGKQAPLTCNQVFRAAGAKLVEER